MLFRFIGRALKGKLRSTSEDGFFCKKDDKEGCFPINKVSRSSRNYSSTILTDLEELSSDDENSVDAYPWALHNQESSPSSKSRSQKKLATRRSHPWTRLVDDASTASIGVSVDETKPKVFSNIHLVKSGLFDRSMDAPDIEFAEATVSEPAQFWPAQFCSLPFDNAWNFDPPEEEIVFSERVVPDKSKDQKVILSNMPPLNEIVHNRKDRSGSDFSELSSQSGQRPHLLEYKLKEGYDAVSPHVRNVSEDIIRSLERKIHREQQREVEETPLKTNIPNKCLILLMDPMKKIFEIVQMPFAPEKTTVGEILAHLPRVSSDYRLAQQVYGGLAYNGTHLCSSMVPVDVVREAVANGKPLFAVPEAYSAEQVELIGNTLLGTPRVSRLLEDQLERLSSGSKRFANNNTPVPTYIESPMRTQ